ncbi:MAG: metal-dependent hydrolase [Planctomycetes bacterium]|nr:metal-dependent hydrolase [Planctomycetota bacterium]
MNGPLIDVNVHLSRWPCRRAPDDETPRLVDRLRRHGVVEAWAGSLDGLLHKDIAAVNARLAEECRAQTAVRLVPFGTVNPMLPDWQEDLRRCAEAHRMPGIRLFPNYHGYDLEHPEFAKLIRLAAERRLIVTLALLMEDERMMHPLLRVAPVDPAPLADRVAQTPGLRLVLLNALRSLRGAPLIKLLGVGDISVEIATLEGVGGVGNLLADIDVGRALFGSHAPIFYFESALLKLKESSLNETELSAMRHENARRLLPIET